MVTKVDGIVAIHLNTKDFGNGAATEKGNKEK